LVRLAPFNGAQRARIGAAKGPDAGFKFFRKCRLKGVAVKYIRDYRAMGSLFRQFAVFDSVHSSEHLIEAQRWEHLAEAEITSHFEECNTTGSATALAGPD
jgi:hypothetical protein